MNRQFTSLREQEWKDFRESKLEWVGVIEAIGEYFNGPETELDEIFEVKKNDYTKRLELRTKDKSRGYSFFQGDAHEERGRSSEEGHKARGHKIIRDFNDYQRHLSGFFWRRD